MVAKDHKKITGSPIQVGEIDTSAPFQSVKDAVNLFGEGAFSGEKPAIKKAKPQSAEVYDTVVQICIIILIGKVKMFLLRLTLSVLLVVNGRFMIKIDY